jgi:N-acetylneuraminic acid mutarotase
MSAAHSPPPRPDKQHQHWWSVGLFTLLAAFVAVLTLAGLVSSQAQPASAAVVDRTTPSRVTPPASHTSSLKPVVRLAVRHDLSPPLRKMKPIRSQRSGKIRVIPFHNRPLTANDAGSTRTADVQTRTADVQTRMGPFTMPSFQQNFDGAALFSPGNPCGCFPPDTNGAVGPNDYVQTVNTALGIWDKQGNPLLGPEDLATLWQGLGGMCDPTVSSSADGGDPVVMYDEAANRWFISQLSFSGGQGFHACLAVSQTGDPTGAYYRYDFLFSQDTLNDYPKFGVWPDGYYMNSDDFLNASDYTGDTVVAFDRQAMLAGKPAASVSFTLGTQYFRLLPSNWEGAAIGENPPAGAPNPFFMECDPNTGGPCTSNQLDEWDFHVDWNNPANATFGLGGAANRTLPTANFNTNLFGIQQPGTPVSLDSLAGGLQYQAAYRNVDGTQHVVLSQSVNAAANPATENQGGINWYDLTNSGSGWSVADQGTYAPDSDSRWMPSINVDASGDIAAGYSVSSSTTFPSIAVAGRLAGDPSGQLSQGEQTMLAGSDVQLGNRWGDYSAMQVDPTDGCTFWYTNEYSGSSTAIDWRTRIGSFRFPSCRAAGHGAITGTVTDASTGKPIASASVSAGGGGTTTDAQGNYRLVLPVGTYNVTVSAFGYVTQTLSGVQVTDGGTTTENEALPVAPTAHVTGTITDGSGHGWPLYASIRVAGDPAGPFWTNPVTGQFQIALPQDGTYSLTYAATLPGYQITPDTVTVGTSDVTHNGSIPVGTSCTAPGYQLQSGTCELVPGGLVVGTVRDANTSGAVNEATVTSSDNPSDTTTTVATPGDPAVGGGYYQMFSSLTGSHPFTVTRTLTNGAGYQPSTQTVNVAADSATLANFTLSAGQLSVSPTSVSKSLVLGKSATATVKITNTGTAAATFNLSDRAGAFQILGKQGAPLRRVQLPEDQRASPGWMGGTEATGESTGSQQQSSGNTWSTIAGYPENGGIMDNSADYLDGNVYSVGGFKGQILSGQILNTAYAYNVYTDTWKKLANMQVAREKPGVAFVNGRLYAIGGWSSSGTNGFPVAETDVYDPSANTWSRVSDNPYPSAAPGVAVVNGKIYVAGGCLDAACSATTEASNRVLRYDPATDNWATVASYPHPVAWESCGGIDGKIYCAGGTNGVNSYSDAYQYNPSTDAWGPIASLPIDLWGSAGGAANGLLVVSTGVTSNGNAFTNQGYAYDPSTDSWAALPNAQNPVLRAGGTCGFYKIGGDTTGGFTPTTFGEGLSGLDQCGTTNVPWLAESPASGTLQPGQSTQVTVTLAATTADGVSQPGTFTAQLAVGQSTPYLVAPVNVTMTVNPPTGWGKVTGTITGAACNGSSAPLHGAQMQASGKNNFAVRLYTGPEGKYSIWAPAADNPLSLTASMTGWGTQVQTVSVKAGKTITANFTLTQNCG